MRHRQIVALVILLVGFALAAGYFLGRHAPGSATAAADAEIALAFDARAMPIPASASKHVFARRADTASVASTAISLPPKATPLKEIFDDLKARADAGDAAAASRLAHDLHKCLAAFQLRRLIPRDFTALELDGDDSKLSAEQLEARASYLDSMKQQLDVVRDSDALCADIGQAEFKTLVPAQLRAAQLGDLSAADCYLAQGVGSPGLIDHPEWLTQFKENALDLANAGIQRGDWVAVGLLGHASGGMFMGLLQQVTGTDPLAVYQYLRLQRLGASGDFASQLDKQIAVSIQQLTPQQIADADAWAQGVYQNYFKGKSSNELSNGTNICQLSDD